MFEKFDTVEVRVYDEDLDKMVWTIGTIRKVKEDGEHFKVYIPLPYYDGGTFHKEDMREY